MGYIIGGQRKYHTEYFSNIYGVYFLRKKGIYLVDYRRVKERHPNRFDAQKASKHQNDNRWRGDGIQLRTCAGIVC